MKDSQVQIGSTYAAKVSGKIVPVRIIAKSPYGGWDAVNTETGRQIRVRSGRRLRYEIKSASQTEA